MALTDNIVSSWKFDESSGNAADSAGSNTLTNNGTATYASGKINNAVVLNGTSQYMSITNAAQTGLNITSDLTMAGWVNFSSYSGATGYLYATKANYDGGASDRQYGFEQNIAANNTLCFLTSNGTTNVRGSVAWTPSTATWYFIAAVYSAAAGTVAFYVNGSQQGTTQSGFNTSLTTTTRPFYIGAGFGSTTNPQGPVPASFDDWSIWSRALSLAEISQLYNGGTGLQYPFGAGTVGTINRGFNLLGVGQ